MTDINVLNEVELAVYMQPAHHTDWTLNAASKIIAGFSVRLMGWSAAETSGGGACTINIYDGADTTGSVTMPIKLASGQSSTDWYGPNGILFKNGLTINLASGQAQGSIYFIHVRR